MADRHVHDLRATGRSEAELESLVRRHLAWIQDRVHGRLGAALRRKAETQDLVQAALLKVLQYGPRARIHDETAFRALLARIVENVIRDEGRWFQARRRAMSRERPLPSDSAILDDPPRADVKRPSQQAGDQELVEWLNLGLELIDEPEREILHLRQWSVLPYSEIGERLGISEDAARMRHGRALSRLAATVRALRRGEARQLLEEGTGGVPAREDVP